MHHGDNESNPRRHKELYKQGEEVFVQAKSFGFLSSNYEEHVSLTTTSFTPSIKRRRVGHSHHQEKESPKIYFVTTHKIIYV